MMSPTPHHIWSRSTADERADAGGHAWALGACRLEGDSSNAHRRSFDAQRSAGPVVLRPQQRLRMRLARGFTLVELMAVVVIVAILAAIAVPGAANRFRENRSQRAANEIASIYRNARMRAMGRGSAVLVSWDGQVFTVQEAIRGGNNEDCAPQPEGQCTIPLDRWTPVGPGQNRFQQLAGRFDPTDLGDIQTTLQMVGGPNAGQNIPTFYMCFSPMGTTFAAVNPPDNNNANVLQPIDGVPMLRVSRQNGVGLTRRVLLLPNGTARVVAEDPTQAPPP